jgi:ribonuclease BN (tRNA processing enzyme)
MNVTCFGSRGSLPSPSRKDFSTVEFGGNTNSYYLEVGPFKILLGCGTGVSVLSDSMMKTWVSQNRTPQCYLVWLSHYHWDHIQGLPFCVPFFIGGNSFDIHGFRPSGFEDDSQPRTAVEMMLAHQQSNPHFPVAHGNLPSTRRYFSYNRQFSETIWYLRTPTGYQRCLMPPLKPDEALKMTTIPVNHPDGCLGVRFDYQGKSLVYCTDTEPLRYLNTNVQRLAAGVDILIMDGAYTEEQLRGACQTFGHGTPRSCVEEAMGVKAKLLIIHHHDPKHDDDKLREMEADAQRYALDLGYTGTVQMAREGTTWSV